MKYSIHLGMCKDWGLLCSDRKIPSDNQYTMMSPKVHIGLLRKAKEGCLVTDTGSLEGRYCNRWNLILNSNPRHKLKEQRLVSCMKNLLDKVNIFRLPKVNSNPSSKELEVKLY